MNALTPAERMELRKLTRRIRTQRATLREVNRAIDLTNRDHRSVIDREIETREVRATIPDDLAAIRAKRNL